MILLNKFLVVLIIVLTSLHSLGQDQTALNCFVNDTNYKEYHGFHFEVITGSDTIYLKYSSKKSHLKYQIDTILVFLNYTESVGSVSRAREIFDNAILVIPPSKITNLPIIKIPVSKYIIPIYSNFSNTELIRMDKEHRRIFKYDCSLSEGVSRVKLIVKGVFEIDSDRKTKIFSKLEKAFRFITSN